MDARDHSVISVLGDQRRFIVPIYQRQYQWGDARLQPFWEDVVAKADEFLSGKLKFSHYMGALILAPGGDGFTVGSTPRVLVVDGQQRLTTFQLFLAALRDVCTELGFPEVGAPINNYLFIPQMYGDKDPNARFRLQPTSEDRIVFQAIVEGGLQAVRKSSPGWFFLNGKPNRGSRPPPAVLAIHFLMERIQTFALAGLPSEDDDVLEQIAPTPVPEPAALAQDQEPGIEDRLRALLEAILRHLKLVVITLAEDDDAQVIFETLNSQAEPLLAMDLVRNNIFHRASTQGEAVEKLFEQKWRPFDEDGAFWKAESPRAKPKRPRIDHFLSHALTAQTGEETSLRELYAEYRSFMRPRGRPRFATVEAELDSLIIYRDVYRTLEVGGSDGALADLGAKLKLWEISTAYPLVFRIAVSDASNEVKQQLYDLTYAYLVRRAFCNLTPKNLNKTFARLTAHMNQAGVSLAAFSAYFARQQGDAGRFPSDTEFRAALQVQPAYWLFRRKERLAEVLWELECALRTKYSVKTPRPDDMSVEHVMPQEWAENWPLPDGRKAPLNKAGGDEVMQAAIARREQSLHRLGNLTLITVPGNTLASNKAFGQKKVWLQESLLALNVPIQNSPTWDEDAIAARGELLADAAVKVWPGLVH